MRLALALSITSLSLAACGGGSDAPPDAAGNDIGFNPPSDVVHANSEAAGSWMDLGPADMTCLNTPTADQPAATAITLNTVVTDFQSGATVANATVTAFPGVDDATVFDTQTSADDGTISFTIPAGTKRFGFKMTADAAMPTFLLNQYVDPNTTPTSEPAKIQSVSQSTGATLSALIGQTRTLGTGVIAGALRDCQHHEVSNFIATVSSTSGTATPIDGAAAYYFSAGVGLPVRHNQQDASSSDGLFMIIQLPPAATAYVQMWGFTSAADLASGKLTLLAELGIPVLADTVVTGSYEPLRN